MEQAFCWVILVVAFILSNIFLVWLGRRMHSREVQRTPRPRLRNDILKVELNTLDAAIEGLGVCLANVERNIGRTELPFEASDADSLAKQKAYGIARRLAQRGLRVADIMSICEITRGEAELIAEFGELSGGCQIYDRRPTAAASNGRAAAEVEVGRQFNPAVAEEQGRRTLEACIPASASNGL